MKAVILAAGVGSRLQPYTDSVPKCMLSLAGKPLLHWQIETLASVGISDITVVAGHCGDRVIAPGARIMRNPDYANTNMVATLLCAREFLSGEIVVCYGDVLFEDRLLRELLADDSEVSVAVDEEWQPYWMIRFGSLLEDSESLRIDSNDRITELGTARCPLSMIDARYIGLIRFSAKGWQDTCTTCDELVSSQGTVKSRPLHEAYMTDLIQGLIDNRVDVKAVRVRRGWLEFDSRRDYEIVVAMQKEGTLGQFFIARPTEFKGEND